MTNRLLCGTALTAFSLALVAGCGSPGIDSVTPPPPPPPPAVAPVTVTPDTATLQVGATVQLTASLRDAANATLAGRAVAWTSDNPSIASVSATGAVTS